jgi:hypothetical protein
MCTLSFNFKTLKNAEVNLKILKFSVNLKRHKLLTVFSGKLSPESTYFRWAFRIFNELCCIYKLVNLLSQAQALTSNADCYNHVDPDNMLG